MSADRVELSTNGLKGHCSAIELRAHSKVHFITHILGRQFQFWHKNPNYCVNSLLCPHTVSEYLIKFLTHVVNAPNGEFTIKSGWRKTLLITCFFKRRDCQHLSFLVIALLVWLLPVMVSFHHRRHSKEGAYVNF